MISEYEKMPVPASDPCAQCAIADKCDHICVARSRWWDHQIRGASATKRKTKRYTVYREGCQDPVAVNATAAVAAAAMGMKNVHTFYNTVDSVKMGLNRRWKIIVKG